MTSSDPTAAAVSREPTPDLTRVPARVKAINLIAIIVPFLGLLSACLFLWGRGFTWADFGLLIGMYLTTALGISVGYHRLFTHRAF